MRRLLAVVACGLLVWLLGMVASGRPDRSRQNEPPMYEPLRFSDDGKSALVLVRYRNPDEGKGKEAFCDVGLDQWDLTTGNVKHLHQPVLKAGTFSPFFLTADGKWVACGEEGAVAVWPLANPKAVCRLNDREAGGLALLAFAPDGKRVATRGERIAQVWDVNKGKPLWRITAADRWFSCACFSPDGKRLATGEEAGTLRVWEAATGHFVRRLVGHKTAIRSVQFAPSGRYLLAGSTGKDGTGPRTVILWELVSGKPVQRFTAPLRSSFLARFTPDGRQVMLAERRWMGTSWQLTFRDAGSGRLIRTGPTFPEVPLFSGDGKRALTGGRNLVLWDALSGEEERTLKGLPLKGFTVRFVVISSDGKEGLSASGDTLVLWDLVRGKEKRVFEPLPGKPLVEDPETGVRDGRRRISGLAADWKGREAITGDWKGVLRFWDLDTGKLRRQVQAYHLRGDEQVIDDRGSVLSVALSPDGKRLWTTGKEVTRGVRVDAWDRAGGNRQSAGEPGSGDDFRILLLPDGKQALLKGYEEGNHVLLLWDLAAKRERWRQQLPRHWVESVVALSPNGKHLITTGREMVLRATETGLAGQTLYKLPPVRHGVADSPVPTAAAISPDGRRLICGNEVGEVVVWDLERGKVERTLVGKGVGMTIRSLALSADGSRALTGGEGGVVKLWDLRLGKEVWTLRRTPRPPDPKSFRPLRPDDK
jgi:WD40 repeat protein